MTKFKKIIPALCMLLISAVLMGTSTYAWFSMNTTVKATGMQVTADSNSSYLLIGNVETVETIQTKKYTELTGDHAAAYVTTGNDNKKVYPAMYGDGSTLGSITTEAGKWYTANNKNIDSATDGIENAQEIQASVKNTYVLEYNMWLTLTKGSPDVTNKAIKVTFTRGESVDSAISAVVVIGTESAMVFDHSKASGADSTTAQKVVLTDKAVVKVSVYVYIDGNSENVNTAHLNAGNALTGTINLQFDLVDVA